MLRVRQRHTQMQLARRVGVSRLSRLVARSGRADRLHLGTVLAIVAGLGARLDMRLLWDGPELDRLLDARHAAIVSVVKRLLERAGWIVRVEASFNSYGDRGRIDLLAWHPATRTLLVLEIKTELVDVQALLGLVDVKIRVARTVAAQFGWEVATVVPAIVFAEDRTTRHRLRTLDSLFDRFELRGRQATAWVRRPIGAPDGLLWLTAAPGGPMPRGLRSQPGCAPRGRQAPPTRNLPCMRALADSHGPGASVPSAQPGPIRPGIRLLPNQ